MDEKMRISNAEMKVMNQIWKAEEMVTVPEVLEILKKILGVTKKGNKLCYFPLVSKEQYEKKEAEGFVESKFGGSLKNFLVAFRGSDKIGKNDMKDLRAWLDELDD